MLVMRINEGYFDSVEQTDLTDDVSSMTSYPEYEFAFVIEISYSLRDIRQQLVHPSVPFDIRDLELFTMFRKDLKRINILFSNMNIVDDYRILVEMYDSSHKAYLSKENPLDYDVSEYIKSEVFLKKMLSMKEYDQLNIGIKVLFNNDSNVSLKNFMEDVKNLRSYASTSNLFKKAYTHWLRLYDKEGNKTTTELVDTVYIGHYNKLNVSPYLFIYDCIYGTDCSNAVGSLKNLFEDKYKMIYANNSKFTRWLIKLHKGLKKQNVFGDFIMNKIIGFVLVSNGAHLILSVEPRDKNQQFSYKDVCSFIYDIFIMKMDNDEMFNNRDVIITLDDGTWISDVKEINYNPKMIAHDDDMGSKFFVGFGDGCGKRIKTDKDTSLRDKFIEYYDHAKRCWNEILDGKALL